jgi:hypothetical protein
MLYDTDISHMLHPPGLPLPHGDSQKGSPGLAAFHKAKSWLLRFSWLSKLASLSDASAALPTLLGLHLP